MGRSWHIVRDQDRVTVARHLPVRFDLSASTVLDGGNAFRLASQIRQDLWRALQNLRGFSPAVEVVAKADGMHVRAGGRLPKPVALNTIERIAAVLENPKNRARWVRCAGGLK